MKSSLCFYTFILIPFPFYSTFARNSQKRSYSTGFLYLSLQHFLSAAHMHRCLCSSSFAAFLSAYPSQHRRSCSSDLAACQQLFLFRTVFTAVHMETVFAEVVLQNRFCSRAVRALARSNWLLSLQASS